MSNSAWLDIPIKQAAMEGRCVDSVLGLAKQSFAEANLAAALDQASANGQPHSDRSH